MLGLKSSSKSAKPLPLDPQTFSQVRPPTPLVPKPVAKKEISALDYGRCEAHYLAEPLNVDGLSFQFSVG